MLNKINDYFRSIIFFTAKKSFTFILYKYTPLARELALNVYSYSPSDLTSLTNSDTFSPSIFSTSSSTKPASFIEYFIVVAGLNGLG